MVPVEELETWVDGRLGRLRLNRPEAINALTKPMIDALLATVAEWEGDPEVTAVLIDGAGERGLCSGADVRALREGLLADDLQARAFLPSELMLNALIATYPKPYVAWMDGVVMGGGLGISAHGSLRLATPRAKMAMPETIIGFFPDVGVTYHLGRAPGELGTHLALTGATVTGADAVHVGLADALVEPDVWDSLVARLVAGDVPEPEELGQTEPEAPLAADREWIDECYAPTGATDAAGLLDEARLIVSRLAEHDNEQARATAAVLEQRCPVSVVVSLAAVREARDLLLAPVRGARAHRDKRPTVLARDGRIGPRMLRRGDFAEGVRAQLVDKDHAPQWEPRTLGDVTAEDVAALVW